MAMRGIMKKIIVSPPNIRFMEGGLSSVTEDRRDYLNNEAVVRDLERILQDGKRTFHECVMDLRCGKRHEINERWENWVNSSRELWMEKNEEEQRRDLDMYWKYLKDYLHRKGIDTSNHGLLLSMKTIKCSSKGVIIEFEIASPDRGLVSINKLVLDRWANLPRQCVNGLLCIRTFRDEAFLMYNPITGEKSPWIETNNKQARNRIAFGFDPQSGEHKVICVSSSSNSDSVSDDHNNNQVVEVLTVGKNTWRRIDAIPPIAIGNDVKVPFYIDGCLYWRFRKTEPEQIMIFDIVTEKFRVIPIPGFVITPDAFSQTVELTEVDGRIAVFERCMSLWIMHEDADGNIKWTYEPDLDEPDDWNGKPDLSIVALTGTNLIFTQSECSDSIFYFNRNTKKTIRFPISPDVDAFQWKRIIQV
ncbi:hypothetical protein MKX03_005462 [Papaver bracteatum]|nr:hypothetical protein MKX03_005462 [Papaver bracteatum]